MYIESPKDELSFVDLIRAAEEKTCESKSFPYKYHVCRCRNCAYCYQGKCALKRCCCMRDRVKARSCTFSEVLGDCFANMAYFTNTEAGHGLAKIGGAFVPFVNRLPKDTELYRMMTTKFGE